MMMSDTGFLRLQNTACDSALSQHESSKSIDYVSERKFIVFESCLDELLGNCPECTALRRITEKKIKGACLRVHRICNNGHQHTWTSQPSVNRRALGDVLLAAATLFSGSIAKKVLRLLRQMGVPCLSYETYFKIQGAFLLPAIRQVWHHKKQNELFEQASGRELVLAGDGRSDSPGRSAKYETYTVVDVSTKKVLHVETVQSNETKGSWAMELEGLKRTVLICEANGLTVGGVITDRHSMIKSFLAKWYPRFGTCSTAGTLQKASRNAWSLLGNSIPFWDSKAGCRQLSSTSIGVRNRATERRRRSFLSALPWWDTWLTCTSMPTPCIQGASTETWGRKSYFLRAMSYFIRDFRHTTS
ncbi:unnamed protein product [Ixodes pacificus]